MVFRLMMVLFITSVGFGELRAEISTCKFNFGTSWQGANYAYPQQVDYVTLWTGAQENFNVYWDGAMLNACKPGGKLAGRTPVYYSYIIAFTARRDQQLQDCNVGTPNLCQKGANYIRQHKDRILSQYAKYASETAKVWGTQNPIVWLMEPDYYQYASDSKQEGGPLTFTEAGALMRELVATIKKSLPNAVFSLDISPWVANPAAWYAAFDMQAFTYNNTSGGETEADNTRIRKTDAMTWKSVHTLTGKPIIADDGYGVAGASTGHDATWDNSTNLNARIADGVIAITQASPKADWNSAIVAARGKLTGLPGCQSEIRWAPVPARRGPDAIAKRVGPVFEFFGNRNTLGQAINSRDGLRLIESDSRTRTHGESKE